MGTIALHTLWSLRSDFIGGTERFLVELSKELTALGHEPFIVCSNLQPELNIEGVRVIGRVPDELRPYYVDCAPNIAKFVRQGIFSECATEEAFLKISEYVQWQLCDLQFDIVHMNAFSAALFAEFDCPKVVTNHENRLELDYFWHDGAFDALTTLVRSNSTQLGQRASLFTPSKHYAEIYSRELGIKVQPNPLGVCLNNFPTNYRNIQTKNKFTILMPSRFYPKQKGQDLALRACQKLHHGSEDQFQFIFSGVRDYYSRYVEEFRCDVESMGLGDFVTIKKYDQIQDGFQEADVVISPERYCSYGLSISEALATGIPTVLSKIPTYLEIARDYDHAVFFDVDDSDGLAASILKASQMHGTHIREGTIKFRHNNDIRECAKRYSAAYDALLSV